MVYEVDLKVDHHVIIGQLRTSNAIKHLWSSTFLEQLDESVAVLPWLVRKFYKIFFCMKFCKKQVLFQTFLLKMHKKWFIISKHAMITNNFRRILYPTLWVNSFLKYAYTANILYHVCTLLELSFICL